MSAPVETPRSAVALLVGAKLVASSHWSGDASIFGHTVINEHQGWTKRSTFLASSLNPLIILIGTLKLQSSGPLYSNTVIGTLTVDGWCSYSWYSEEGPERAATPPSPFLTVPNVTARSSTASVPTSYYSVWHYNYLWSLKGYNGIGYLITIMMVVRHYSQTQ